MTFDPRQITAQEYRDRVRTLEARLVREEQACRKTEAELDWVRTGVELFVAGDAPTETAPPLTGGVSTNGNKPSLREAILRVMGEKPGKPWKAPELMGVLEQRGWMPNSPEHAEHIVRSRLSTLTKAGELRKVGYGLYKLPKGASTP